MKPYNKNPYSIRPRKGFRLRKGRLLFVGLLLVLVIVIISGLRFIGSFQKLQNQEDWAAALREESQEAGTNHLLFGVTRRNGDSYADKILLYNIKNDRGSPNVIFLPGETVVDVPSFGPGTLGDAFSEGGTKLLLDTVMEFLDVPVHHYVKIDYEVIPVLAEELGEIPLQGHLLEPLDFYDYFLQEENFEPINVLTHRRQNLGLLLENLTDRYSSRHVPGIVRQVSPLVETDFSWKELSSFYLEASPLFKAETTVVTLPGRWEAAYFVPDEDAVALMMSRLGEELLLPRDQIAVEVLNGSGVAGIASLVGDWLANQGFSVKNIDNADHFEYMRSRVIGKTEDMESAREVALFIPGADLEKEPEEDYEYTVKVIVGRNFEPERLTDNDVEQPEGNR